MWRSASASVSASPCLPLCLPASLRFAFCAASAFLIPFAPGDKRYTNLLWDGGRPVIHIRFLSSSKRLFRISIPSTKNNDQARVRGSCTSFVSPGLYPSTSPSFYVPGPASPCLSVATGATDGSILSDMKRHGPLLDTWARSRDEVYISTTVCTLPRHLVRGRR